MCRQDAEANTIESQHVFAPTQGQDQLTLTNNSIVSRSKKARKIQNTRFAFEDDEVDATLEKESEMDIQQKVESEIKQYLRITLTKEQKAEFNILDWWQKYKDNYPCLFKAAVACLHIPATSVPAELIFSLAGYVVRNRRYNLLPSNINKLIFLHQNAKNIRETISVIEIN